MKIAVLCNSRLGIPAIQQLAATGQLCVCAIPDRQHEENEEIAWMCRQLQIPLHTFSHKQVKEEMAGWLHDHRPDVVLVFTFPYLIPESLLGIPAYGFINFHFGLLPAYRGSDAIFWQIRNRESMGGISIHRMTAELDKGLLYAIQQVPIHAHDTYGSHGNALAFAAAKAVLNLTPLLEQNMQPIPQEEQYAGYYKRPVMDDVLIDWTRSAAEIVALVHACNPWNKGALSTINGYPFKIISAHVGENDGTTRGQPGEILQANAARGLVVACGQNELLAIDIGYFSNEYISPQRLNYLGIQPGLYFDQKKMLHRKSQVSNIV